MAPGRLPGELNRADRLWSLAHGSRPLAAAALASNSPPFSTVCRFADRRELQRKTPKQAAIALANRMARTACAVMKNQTEFRAANAA